MLSSVDARAFRALAEINALIASPYGDVHGVFGRIVDLAAQLCEGEAASLLLLSGDELSFEAASGGSAAAGRRVKAGEGIAGWVVRHNASLITNDAENDERHRGSGSRKFGCAVRNIIAAPVRLRDACIGVIEVLNKKKNRAFSQEDLELLEIAANQAALAVRSADPGGPPPEEVQQAEGGYKTLIAKSPVTREKLALLDRIAAADSSVLIRGESGVGKEVFAEQIHLRGPRAGGPFVRMNCAALPEGLLESELFGHVKGAFTSAVKSRRGRFELASGGTLFLDEIGDMPLPLQAKLLRALQQKTFERVGSDEPVTVDVRILAATNRDIEALVGQGRFREDLYYRLNVLPLTVPPLRERPEDIMELAAFFLKRSAEKMRKEIGGFSGAAREAMLLYSWPGNVRELENCVERACVIGKGGLIEPEDLLLKRMEPAAGEERGGERDLKAAVNAFKSRFIQQVLEEYNWKQTEAAKALNIQRTYLSLLIREFHLINPKETNHGKE